MKIKLFKRSNDMPISISQRDLVYSATYTQNAKLEQREIARSFTRLFASEDGQKVLAHLQVITFHRALGPASEDAQLRYLEGQRALVATILRLIDKGRQ